MSDNKSSHAAISRKTGRALKTISRFLKASGRKPRRNLREAHQNWQGGRVKDGSGYFRVLVEPDDPLAGMANQGGYALEHRMVMARELGRPLLKSETVHHINGDPADNRIENLQLRQGKHGKGVVLCCLNCGSQNVGPIPIREAANDG